MTFAEEVERNAAQERVEIHRRRKLVESTEKKIDTIAKISVVGSLFSAASSVLITLIMIWVLVAFVFPSAVMKYHDLRADRAAKVADCNAAIEHGLKGTPSKYPSRLTLCVRNMKIEYNMVGRNRHI